MICFLVFQYMETTMFARAGAIGTRRVLPQRRSVSWAVSRPVIPERLSCDIGDLAFFGDDDSEDWRAVIGFASLDKVRTKCGLGW
jgi:hypothetical protein